MMTINLEKELIKQNSYTAISKEELLVLKEYEKFTTITSSEVLTRTGLNSNLIKGKNVKTKISKFIEDTEKFNQERVFSITQIKSICIKYDLRFLDINRYKGTIDEQLPIKLSNFEAAYNLKLKQSDLKIVAPKESFHLESRPKDPLLFYKINENYYYLIHKWGRDLNIFRIIKGLCRYTFFFPITLFSVLNIPLIISFFKEHFEKSEILKAILVFFLIETIIIVIVLFATMISNWSDNNKDDWQSDYK